jgi:tetratricopeptide (TPR) repeat protein
MRLLTESRSLLIAAVLSVGCAFTPALAAPPPDRSATAVSLRLIVVESADKAQRTLELLKGGADFAVLAKETSTDPTSEDGGFMGDVDPTMLRAELQAALNGLIPGEFSGVVKLPRGYAILKLLKAEELIALERAKQAREFAINSRLTLRYSFGVDGLSDAESAWNNFPKEEHWEQDLRRSCQTQRQSMAALTERQNRLLAEAQASPATEKTDYDILSLQLSIGLHSAYKGEMDQAIGVWEQAYPVALAEIPKAADYLDEMIGIGYLQKLQMENGVYHSPGDRCIFPMAAGASYARTESGETAIRHFLSSLEKKPDDLELKWLLNLAYMMLGQYPADVPQRYLLPPPLFESTADIGRFKDVAPEAGLDAFDEAGGMIVDDFENNGLFDVATSSFDACGPMHYFHNNGDGTFTDRTAKAGLSNQLGGLNMIQADYNNDGCVDILVLRGGWELTAQRKSLLRNNCDGTFTDVTKEAGLAEPTRTQAAVWVDINNDGLLDLFVGNENGPAQLFLNNGDGTFKDISHSAGIDKVSFAKGVAAADYDNDGYVDLYVSNLMGDNYLYHNNHDLTFTDVAKEAGVLGGPGQGFATWFFDYDNDGLPDLFVTSYYMSLDETVRTYVGLPHNATTLKLYKNLGNGTFRDVTAETRLDKVFMPMGANFGDVDNDGYLDIYLGNGNPSYASLTPSVLLHNKDGKYFENITASSGLGELHKGHGIAFADMANTGNEDILFRVGGAIPGDSHAVRLFKNPGNHGNDWMSLHLVGVKANRSAIGARIKVTVENGGQGVRAIYRTVGSGGSFGASPFTQHIGLGKSARILSLEIWWPNGSRTPQKFTNVGKNQYLEIRESALEYTKLVRPPFQLGGATGDAVAHLKESGQATKQGSKQ